MWKKVLESTLLVFTFLLPLKFTHALGMPGVPASYWGDFFSLIYTGWSPHIFALISGLLFAAYALSTGFRQKKASVQMLLWVLLAFASLAGCLRASCREYVRQTVDVLFGLSCFAGALHLAVENDENILKKLRTVMATGAVLTVWSGWDQILTGLQAVRDYVASNQLDSTFSESMNRQIMSNRIYGTFQLSNTYAGYLAAFLPFLILTVLEQRNLTGAAKWTLLGFVAAAVCVPLVMTGSRGALLSLGIGSFFTAFFIVRRKKLLLTCAVAAACVLTGLILFWRGANSMIFRLDYDWAAFRMMLEHPFSGTGWGDFFHEYLGKKLLHNDESPHSPHNLVLFFGSQCGIAGFLIAAAISFYPLYRGFRKLKRDGLENADYRLAALLAALLTLTVDAQLEVGIESPAYAATLILFSTLVLRRTKEADQTILLHWKVPPFRHIGIGIIIAGLTIAAAAVEIRREKAYANLFEHVYPQFSRNPAQKPHPADIRKAYSAAPQDSPFVHLTMAAWLERTGQYPAAIQAVSLAVELSPEDTGARRHRLNLLLRTGSDPDTAENDRNFILNADPGNPQNKWIVKP